MREEQERNFDENGATQEFKNYVKIQNANKGEEARRNKS